MNYLRDSCLESNHDGIETFARGEQDVSLRQVLNRTMMELKPAYGTQYQIKFESLESNHDGIETSEMNCGHLIHKQS